jgi:hypothetical protein
MDTSIRPKGDIKTVLDLADRDAQDDFFNPLTSRDTFLLRNQTRTIPFTPTYQTFPYRGPATFGSTIAVDLKSTEVGDLLHYVAVQIQLGSWIRSTDLFKFFSGAYTFANTGTAWTWANAIGIALIERAWIMIGDTTIETINSEFTAIFSALFPNINEQFGVATDAYGYFTKAADINPNRPFTTENGNIFCSLPFWFSRTRLAESLPLTSCKDGTVTLYIKFREFADVVRQVQGYRDSCTAVPLGITQTVVTTPNVNNFLKAVTKTAGPTYLTGSTYNIPLYSPNYVRQTLILTEPFTTLRLGITAALFVNVPYLNLVFESAYVMNLSTIEFYLVEDTGISPFVLTLPSGGIVNTKVAALTLNNMRITSVSPLTITFSGVTLEVQGISTITTVTVPPPFQNIEIATLSSMVDGTYREKLMRSTHEMLYRELQPFYFSEPLKYTISLPGGTGAGINTVTVGIPLECNGPVEEILWVIRRRGVAVNNEWTNFGPLLESQMEDGRYALPPLESASIWINGVPFVEQSGDWYRTHIAEKHKGGIVAYNRYIYGYTFARHPGRHQPSGSINASKASSIQLRLTVRAPRTDALPAGFNPDLAGSWEVFVYCIGINWLRFQNGIGNRVYSN